MRLAAGHNLNSHTTAERIGVAMMAVVAVTVMAAFQLLGGIASSASVGRMDAIGNRVTVVGTDFSLTVDPTQGLSDGEPMTFTVNRTATGTAAGLEIASVNTGWCQADAVLPASANQGLNNYSALVEEGGFPVLNVAGSSTPVPCVGNVNNSAPITGEAISPPKNSSGDYPTVSSTTFAETGLQGAVTCDSGDPCLFAVAIWATNINQPGATETILPLAVPVTFASASLSASCGGTAPGEITSAGSDRLSPLVGQWTLAACAAGVGGGKELTDNTSSAQSDATALAGFADGSDDLVYSAVGYNATNSPGYASDTNFTPATDRPYVAIPIALNAVVFAHAQSNVVPSVVNPVLGPFSSQLSLTVDQAAKLVANGGFETGGYTWGGPLGTSLLADGQNSVLEGDVHYGRPNTIAQPLVATSGTNATTLFATAFLHALAPASDLISVPVYTSDPPVPSEPLVVTANFGTTIPSYYVNTVTGSSLLAKAMTPLGVSEWALTDAATAAHTWGGLADFALQVPSSIGSATPVFAPPDQANMDAAVADMNAQPDGTLLPDPSNSAAVNGVEPYPLTYVEYAIAPTQPLLNTDCTPDTAAQNDLTAWLSYITGYGQTLLTPSSGLAPLTPALDAQAQAAIAKIGKAAPTCTPTPAPTGTTPVTTTPAPTGSTGSTATATATPASTSTYASEPFATTGLPPSAFDLGVSAAVLPPGATPHGSIAGAKAALHHARTSGPDVATELAGFHGTEGMSWALPVFGVLVLALLIPGLVLLLSGRSLGSGLRGRPEDDQYLPDGDQP